MQEDGTGGQLSRSFFYAACAELHPLSMEPGTLNRNSRGNLALAVVVVSGMKRETDPDSGPATPKPANAARRSRKRAGIAAIISLAIIAGTIGLAFLPDSPEPAGGAVPASPTDIEYRSYETTDDLLADFAGRPLVVNFFASWCAPCRAELPHFADAHAEYGDRVGFVGVDYQDPDRDAAIALLIEAGVRYPIAEDPTGAILDELSGLPAMPTTIFVAADGSIVERHRGIILIDGLSAKIEGLL